MIFCGKPVFWDDQHAGNMSTDCVFDIFGWKNSFQSKIVHDQVHLFYRKSYFPQLYSKQNHHF